MLSVAYICNSLLLLTVATIPYCLQGTLDYCSSFSFLLNIAYSYGSPLLLTGVAVSWGWEYSNDDRLSEEFCPGHFSKSNIPRLLKFVWQIDLT